MINKPYSLLPSELEDGSGVIDITQDVTFSFQVTGTSPIYQVGIQIGDLSGTPSDPIIPNLATPIYYTNIDGSAKTLTITVDATTLQAKIGNSYEQQWRVIVWDAAGDPVYSDWVFVQLKSIPVATISTPTTAATKSNTWTLDYTPSYTYVNKQLSSDATSMRSLRWRVYDESDAAVALYDTGEIFGCVEPTYTVDGLRSGHTYYATITVIDQDGVETNARSQSVAVSYAQTSGGIMTLVYTDEIADVPDLFGRGREIALDLTQFSGIPGISELGRDGYEIEKVADVGYVLENRSGNTITYDGIVYHPADSTTLRMKFTPYPYRAGNDIATLYIDDAETMRIRYAVTNDGGLTPSDSLTPAANLVPSVRDYFITAFFESLIDGRWEVTGTDTFALENLELMTDDDFIYFEHTFSMDELFVPDYALYTNKPQINGVELEGDKSFEDLSIDVPSPLSDAEIDAAIGWEDS